MGDVALRDCGCWLSGGTPDTENPSNWGGDIPWITSSSLKRRYLDRSVRRLTKEGVAAGSRLVEPGTLIFVVRGMSLKSEFRVGISTTQLAFGQDCKALVPAEGIDAKYLLFALEAAEDRVLRMVDEASHGTGRLQTSLLGSLKVRVPQLEEQRQIAEVLDTIDETIQATERVIAKLALTRDGVLRHQLSGLLDGPMAPLSDLGAEVTVGIVVRPTQYYVTDGVPVLRSANVREDGLEMTNLVFMSPVDHALMSKTAVKPGDLVTVRTGYPGTTAVVPESVREANCVDIVITRTGPAIDPEFLSLWVNSDFGKGHVLARQGGLAQQHFNVGDMKGLPVPVLDRPEQQRLVKVRDSLISRLRAEKSSLSKLRRTRAGLADDLLSGRVRTVAA